MKLTRFALVLVLLTLTLIQVSAQSQYSMVIEVRREGAEIRRENTDLWLPLPRQAIAFIGSGDTIRTDAEGRVHIPIDDTAQILLLSNSEFTLTDLTVDDSISVAGMITGNAVIQTTEDTDFASFALDLQDMQITQPARLMSVWSFPDEVDTLTVAEGTAIVAYNDTQVEVSEKTGYRAEPDRTSAIAFHPQWNAARLEAQLYGCEGEVQTIGNVTLLVRTGPGGGFQPMGTLDVGRIVSVMAQTETTEWTRIQFLTGFGWIRSTAIESDCTDIPILPDNTPEERFITVYNASAEETAILQPFFMSPADNAFVYRFVNN